MAEALAELPAHLLGDSDWSDPPPAPALPAAPAEAAPTDAPSLSARLRNLLHVRKP